MPISTIGANGLGSGAVTNAKIDTMAATKLTGQVPDANAPSGSVIQIVSAAKTDIFSTSLPKGSWADVTGLSVSITPVSTSSRILVLGQIMGNSAGYPGYFYTRILRNSTAIGVGDAAGSRAQVSTYTQIDTAANNSAATMPFIFLDSPNTTSATIYKLQIAQNTGSGTNPIYINSSSGDLDDFSRPRGISVITVMEIAA